MPPQAHALSGAGCTERWVHTFVPRTSSVRVHRQWEYLVTLSGFLYTFFARSSSDADLERSCGSSACRRTLAEPQRRVFLSCQKRPVPLRLGAASADAAGKLLLLLYVDLNCCPEALQLVSHDGSFAKRPPRPRLGVCRGAPGAGWRAARAPWQPALVVTVPWRRRGGRKATRG